MPPRFTGRFHQHVFLRLSWVSLAGCLLDLMVGVPQQTPISSGIVHGDVMPGRIFPFLAVEDMHVGRLTGLVGYCQATAAVASTMYSTAVTSTKDSEP
jgi:hypothetical protein